MARCMGDRIVRYVPLAQVRVWSVGTAQLLCVVQTGRAVHEQVKRLKKQPLTALHRVQLEAANAPRGFNQRNRSV
jgi:hypothetical protein